MTTKPNNLSFTKISIQFDLKCHFFWLTELNQTIYTHIYNQKPVRIKHILYIKLNQTKQMVQFGTTKQKL